MYIKSHITCTWQLYSAMLSSRVQRRLATAPAMPAMPTVAVAVALPVAATPVPVVVVDGAPSIYDSDV